MSIKISRITWAASVTGAIAALTLSAAHAGGPNGCMYGYGAEQLASENAEQSPLLAEQYQDPKWLALQNRLRLEAQSADETIVVPN